jgi:hypothetical protein
MDTKKFQEKIYFRAMKDNAFRNELKKNPRQVIERELGEKLPPNSNWEVIEQTSKKQYIVLPDIQETHNLSNDELKKVAAGVGMTGSCTGC